MVIPELEPLEEAVAGFGAWRARARDLLADRPSLDQLKAAVKEVAALPARFPSLPPLINHLLCCPDLHQTITHTGVTCSHCMLQRFTVRMKGMETAPDGSMYDPLLLQGYP